MTAPDALLASLLDDPPRPHIDPVHLSPPGGVWRARDELYAFLARSVVQGMRTLETGCGISTALLAGLGAHHTCVVFIESEAVRVRSYCEERGLPTSHLRFEIGSSDEILPRLTQDPLDLVLIDGCHGYPFPALDWYYSSRRLVKGGITVLDDLALPAPRQVADFLSIDPRWQTVETGDNFAAFRRLTDHSLQEEWGHQLFLVDALRASEQKPDETISVPPMSVRLARKLRSVGARGLRRMRLR